MTDDSAPVQILLVEDSPGDVNLTREALRSARIRNDLHVVGDGEAALAFMRQEGEHADAPRPDIVLLDLNLPKLDGRQVLEAIKADPELLQIPVIVLTTSSADEDVARAYANHANCFITKPVAFDQFLAAVRSLEGFWLEIVRLPQPDES